MREGNGVIAKCRVKMEKCKICDFSQFIGPVPHFQ